MPLKSASEILGAGAAGGLWGWAALSGLALITSSVILAFIYVWGTFFRSSQLIAYVKQEFYEIMVTVLLIPLIFIAVGAMSTLHVSDFAPADLVPQNLGDDATIYDATEQYYLQVEDDMSGWLNLNYIMNIYIDQIASVTPYARPLGVGLVTSPLAGLASPIKQLLYNMTVALSIAFVLNHAQLVVYIFSLQAFLNYYLPLGIFLRSFTPTRKVGGALIGVALSFLFVLPVLSTITYSMFYSSNAPLVTFRSMVVAYMDDTSDRGFQHAMGSFFGTNFSSSGSGLVGLITGAFGSIGTALQNVIGGALLVLLIFPMSIVSWAFAIGFVIPAFNIIIFTQAAKGLSKSFGEEVDISSLTRLI